MSDDKALAELFAILSDVGQRIAEARARGERVDEDALADNAKKRIAEIDIP